MAGGRPIEYNNGFVAKAEEYLALCVDEEYEYHKTRGDTSNSFERKLKVKLPTLEGLAVYLGISRSTLYLWKEQYEEFSDIVEKLQATQADRVLNNATSGDYNSAIAKVLLTKHGYREGTDITTNDKDIAPSPDHIALANAAIDALLNGHKRNTEKE